MRPRKMSREQFAEWFASRSEPEPNTGCFLWLGAVGSDGYGQLGIGGRTVGAHRVAYAIAHGCDVRSFGLIDHICSHRVCVNPDHLRELSFAENIRRGRLAKLTHCKARDIRERYAAGGISQQSLADEYRVSQVLISKVVLRTAWVAV